MIYGGRIMIFQKAIMNPHEEKMVEHRNAQISNQQSLIEYIAVMSDIVIYYYTLYIIYITRQYRFIAETDMLFSG